ncbi:hypothetical protein BDA96_01G205200 [Sorghum bicolor]|uniref:Uncharacterized protein n=2 Tax=Sorghum bicolor TaxID=4558 RepID=A0A921V0R8_SORBI|nr:hypothetical protein BDA96_01G205200 [Sorghum bicolor]KXG38187.1 hypothetical protein SORBI_3001G194700 [Sorghum bicolor]
MSLHSPYSLCLPQRALRATDAASMLEVYRCYWHWLLGFLISTGGEVAAPSMSPALTSTSSAPTTRSSASPLVSLAEPLRIFMDLGSLSKGSGQASRRQMLSSGHRRAWRRTNLVF